MKIFNQVEEVINSHYLPKGTMVYCAGNASTPQVLLKQIVRYPPSSEKIFKPCVVFLTVSDPDNGVIIVLPTMRGKLLNCIVLRAIVGC